MPNISSLITERELLDFSQNFAVARNYMGSRLFPDRKTQYIEQEYTRLARNGNLPIVAKVHAFDTEAAIGSRVPFEKVEIEELLIKEKINLTESVARVTRGLSMEMDTLRRYVFDDVARLAEGVVTRAEVAKMDALTTGKMSVRENGATIDVDYGVPAENRVASDWTDAGADILGDVRKWRMTAIGNGVPPTVAITTEKVLLCIMQNKGVQKAIYGTVGEGTLPTLDDVNALFRAQFGVSIAVNEDRYGVMGTGEDGLATVKQARFFPEGTFVLTSTGMDGEVGTGLWGVTPEEAAVGGAFDSRRQSQFVTCVTWETPDPVATWSKASGVFIPVMPNVYGHIIATVGGSTLSEG